MSLTLNDKFVKDCFDAKTAAEYAEKAKKALATTLEGTGEGSDFLGWVTLPEDYDKEEFARIKKAAAKIKSDSKYLVVIGIGGSYLGARSAIDFLPACKKGGVKVLFAGNNLSAEYINDIIEEIGDDDFSVNVISKSGTTTEPAVAFRILFRCMAAILCSLRQITARR